MKSHVVLCSIAMGGHILCAVLTLLGFLAVLPGQDAGALNLITAGFACYMVFNVASISPEPDSGRTGFVFHRTGILLGAMLAIQPIIVLLYFQSQT